MRIFFTIILLYTIAFCKAQQVLNTNATFITKFPFKQYSGGVMVIQAKFSNLPHTLNFILDTGSGGISLDSTTCADLNIPLTQTDTIITGIGGTHKVSFAFNKTLQLPGLVVNKLNFHVNNYEILSSVYGEKIDGIIGYSFFSKYIVKINFDSLQIEVFTPGKIIYPEEGTLLNPIFTALPIQWVKLKDRKKMGFNFYFDTGAGLCLLISEKFAKDSAVLLSRRKPLITQAEGMGGKLQMRLSVIKEVKIGPYKFRGVPTYIYDDSYNVTSYPFVGGLLGNDLLRRFNIIFNYPQKEIHLQPNSRFSEAFDYAYTGLGIYYTDGKIMVEDVIEKSPADKAGFKIGDEIITVGKNFSHNIQAYKNILQNPNQEIKVVVKRNTELLLLFLKTISIR
jgi:Aspartyl protease/PDZ domain